MSLTVLFNCPRKNFSTRLTSAVHVQTCGFLSLFETVMITNSIQGCVLSKCIGGFQSPATVCDEKRLTIRLLSGLFTLSWLYQSFLLAQEATLSFTAFYCLLVYLLWLFLIWPEMTWVPLNMFSDSSFSRRAHSSSKSKVVFLKLWYFCKWKGILLGQQL